MSIDELIEIAKVLIPEGYGVAINISQPPRTEPLLPIAIKGHKGPEPPRHLSIQVEAEYPVPFAAVRDLQRLVEPFGAHVVIKREGVFITDG